jgi:hypothetical protein
MCARLSFERTTETDTKGILYTVKPGETLQKKDMSRIQQKMQLDCRKHACIDFLPECLVLFEAPSCQKVTLRTVAAVSQRHSAFFFKYPYHSTVLCIEMPCTCLHLSSACGTARCQNLQRKCFFFTFISHWYFFAT